MPTFESELHQSSSSSLGECSAASTIADLTPESQVTFPARLPDVVLCGTASSDGATECVGPELATFLAFLVVIMVRDMTETGGNRGS